MKRPIGSILLGLFLVSQVILQAPRLWPAMPVFGRGEVLPAWSAVVPTRTRAVVTLADQVVLQGTNGALWALSGGVHVLARPLATRVVDQELPGGVFIRVDLARIDRRFRLVAVIGAPAWTSPDGAAAALYDRADRAMWAITAGDVRPRPLGSAPQSLRQALAWSASGDRLAYLSGQPARVWLWKVGAYAQEMAGAQGRPAAVRADGTLVLTDAGGDPALYLPGVGATVPVADGRALATSPNGQEALVAHAGRVFLTDLDTGRSLALPLRADEVRQAVWAAGGRVAVLCGGGAGEGQVLVAGLTGERLRWLELPAGARIAPAGLVALGADRLVANLVQGDREVTYVYQETSGPA